MKVCTLLFIVALWIAVPSFVTAQNSYSGERKNHVELGAFADYYRFNPNSSTTVNFIGLGGRAGFYMSEHASIEAEMAYDFKRNFSTFDNITTTLTTTRLRPLHGLFGPKFDLGGHGFDFFLTGKVGFVNFGSTTATAQQGFQNAFTSINNGNTKFALYPGGGIEGFWGPFGLRLDVGDEIYFAGGANNNLRVTFGPHFKF
ncbi:MAG TPA: hypothetical protein VFI95_25045 [Terriglobales bacterium]|nr:hypothetical protein [Terriglobales bacterium]